MLKSILWQNKFYLEQKKKLYLKEIKKNIWKSNIEICCKCVKERHQNCNAILCFPTLKIYLWLNNSIFTFLFSTFRYIMTGSYNNFFRVFDRHTKRDVTLEASKEIAKPKTVLKPRKVSFDFSSCVIVKIKIKLWFYLKCFINNFIKKNDLVIHIFLMHLYM